MRTGRQEYKRGMGALTPCTSFCGRGGKPASAGDVKYGTFQKEKYLLHS